MAQLLNREARSFYLGICASIEKALTEVCKEKNDPCLKDGCAMSEEERCLNACLIAEELYTRQCASVWTEFFNNPNNRINVWKN